MMVVLIAVLVVTVVLWIGMPLIAVICLAWTGVDLERTLGQRDRAGEPTPITARRLFFGGCVVGGFVCTMVILIFLLALSGDAWRP